MGPDAELLAQPFNSYGYATHDSGFTARTVITNSYCGSVWYSSRTLKSSTASPCTNAVAARTFPCAEMFTSASGKVFSISLRTECVVKFQQEGPFHSS